ncbi:SpoIID/LytB domain-containing protein [Robertmurraya massiliosenegalensis]|uniref:SpoIID/LytB domain-containing protein n=1 Tax=Robertmurraya TaxID=2837507 RepID=UPI0039A6B6CF
MKCSQHGTIEALKTQTLAARTYTITHKDAELDDTIQYQVYGWYYYPGTEIAVYEGAEAKVNN